MKVANFTDTYPPHHNGVATVLYALHHAKKEWQDTLFGPLEHPDVVKVAGLPFPLFPEYKIAINTGWLKKRVADFDVIHNHTPYGMFYYGWNIARSLQKPLVGTFHTDPAAVFGALLATESRFGRPATKITWKYLIGIYNKCDTVIAVSGWLARELKKLGMKAPIEIIPNGLDVKKFNPDVDHKAFKEKYDLPDKPIVLFLGRLQHKKDPETFVRAALASKSDATFVLSGHGELEGDLKQLAGDDPRIKFLGFLPSEMVPPAYAAADLFIFPSEMETQGMVVLEAMACGTPCVATDVGISSDVLKPEYIVQPKDFKGIAERVDRLLKDEKTRHQLAKDGRKLVEKEYSMEAMVRKLGDLYERMSREKK